jgi:hypothetical protein
MKINLTILNKINLLKFMNKKFLSGFAVLAIAAVAAWNVNFNSQTNGMSDLALANIEALAGENGDGYSCTCGNVTRDCKKN